MTKYNEFEMGQYKSQCETQNELNGLNIAVEEHLCEH